MRQLKRNPKYHRSPEENLRRKELIARAKEGDKRAFAEFYKINEGLFFRVLTPYLAKLTHNDKDDLIQEGMLGLMKGIEKFNPSKLNESAKPESYVFMWVTAYAQKFIEKVETKNKHFRQPRIQLDNGDFVEGSYVLEHIADTKVSPEDLFLNKELELAMDKFESSLSSRDKVVYKARIKNDTPVNQGVLAKMLNGVSHQWISTLEQKIRKNLKEFIQKEYLQAA